MHLLDAPHKEVIFWVSPANHPSGCHRGRPVIWCCTAGYPDIGTYGAIHRPLLGAMYTYISVYVDEVSQ